MFSLEAVINGKPVRTKEGRQAIFVCFLKDENIPARLVMAIHTGLDGEANYVMQNYYLNGRFIPPCDSEMDLEMEDPFDYYFDLMDVDDSDNEDETWPVEVPLRNFWLTGSADFKNNLPLDGGVPQPITTMFQYADKVIDQMKSVAKQ